MGKERQYVSFKIDERVAVVTVNRPPVNAWNIQVESEVKQVFEELSTRDDFGVVVITGGGNRAFIAGADIKMMSEMGPKEAFEMSANSKVVMNCIEEFDRVVIAAINGLALGGGCKWRWLTLYAADETAFLGLPEVSLSLFPGAGGTQRLPRLVGMGKAKQLIFMGDHISAQEAKEIGLIQKVTPKGEALSEAKKMAKRIMERGPLAVVKAKRAINGWARLPVEAGFKLETELSASFCNKRPERGRKAFREKKA
jgi:enoyl-CoA hydratase